MKQTDIAITILICDFIIKSKFIENIYFTDKMENNFQWETAFN